MESIAGVIFLISVHCCILMVVIVKGIVDGMPLIFGSEQSMMLSFGWKLTPTTHFTVNFVGHALYVPGPTSLSDMLFL